MTMPARNYNSTEIFNVDLKKKTGVKTQVILLPQSNCRYVQREAHHSSVSSLDMICQDRKGKIKRV